jgi:hypothetical protein
MAFNYSPKIITDGLVFCLDAANTRSYPGSGTVWSDLSRGGNNGTLTNGPTFNSGNGGSIVFDGVDDYVNTPLNIDNITCTLNAWFYPTNVAGARGIMLNDNGNWDRGFEVNGGFIGIHIGNNLTITTIPIVINTWYYGSLIYTSNSMNFYLNGVLSWTGGTPAISAGSTLEIGRANFSNGAGSRFFIGRMGNISTYNRALSAQEILQNYNATKTRFGL